MEKLNLNDVVRGLEETVDDLRAWEGIVYDGDRGQITAMKNRVQKAVDLLKEQEPVKPVPAIDNVGDWLCGNCYQSVVGEEELDASGFVPVKFNFCPNCGRAVKWE